MVATTRSQAKKADKLGVSESKSKSAEINKKTWRDWMTNRVVMDKARELWTREIFREKQRVENPALLGTHKLRYVAKREWDSVADTTHKLRYVAKREWDSVADTDKAPFITKALDALAPGAVLAGALLTRKAVKKTSKQTRQSELYHACYSFRDDYYENHLMTHPDYKLTLEVMEAADRAWPSLAEGDKAVYFAEAKKREIDYDELCKYLQHNEAYKDQLYSYML